MNLQAAVLGMVLFSRYTIAARRTKIAEVLCAGGIRLPPETQAPRGFAEGNTTVGEVGSTNKTAILSFYAPFLPLLRMIHFCSSPTKSGETDRNGSVVSPLAFL